MTFRSCLFQQYISLVDNPSEIKHGQPFPSDYLQPLKLLWNDQGVQAAYARGNESALPENLP